MTSTIRSAADILAEIRASGGEEGPSERTRRSEPPATPPPGTSLVIRWEEPPPMSPLGNHGNRGRRMSKLEPLAAELRANPGRWALVFQGSKGKGGAMCTHIRLGQMLAFTPTGDFEATTRAHDGVTSVYARYVGDEG